MLEVALLLVAFTLASFVGGGTGMLITFIAIGLCIPGLLVMRGAAPYVMTPKKTMRMMLDLAAIKKGDTVYDLGCGDGRLVFEAAKRGAEAVGYEFSLPTYVVAKVRSWFHPQAKILYGNFWTKDYRDADVVFCYLLSDTMPIFEKKIWPMLKPGCRVVSHAFSMKDVQPKRKEGGVLLYVRGE